MSHSCSCYCCSTASNCTVSLIGSIVQISNCDIYRCHSSYPSDCPLVGGEVKAVEVPSALPGIWIIIFIFMASMILIIILFILFYYTTIFQNCCSCSSLRTLQVYPSDELVHEQVPFEGAAQQIIEREADGDALNSTLRLEDLEYISNIEFKDCISESL